MKKLINFCLFLFLPSYFCVGQLIYNDVEDVSTYFWGEADSLNESFVLPEKWKNESVVIVYKNLNYSYQKNHHYTSSKRLKLYMNDKAAIETYSTIEASTNSKVVIGIKIIKPDGKEEIVTLSKFKGSTKINTKFAIPNLEVGDILDYFRIEFGKRYFNLNYIFEDPIEETIATTYPIKEFKLRIDLHSNQKFLNFKSFNGAPELKKMESKPKKIRRYELYETDIEKQDAHYWHYPIKHLPAYKMEVIFLREPIYKDFIYAFIDTEEREVKSEVSKQEVLNLVHTFFNYKTDPIHFNLRKNLEQYLGTKSFSNEFEEMEAVYNFMRFQYNTRRILNKVHHDYRSLSKKNALPYASFPNSGTYKSDMAFIREFTAYLKDKKKDFRLLATKKRTDGSMEDLFISRNIKYLIQLNLDGKNYLIDNFGRNRNFGTLSPLTEQTQAYSIQIDGETTSMEQVSVMIPWSSAQKNVLKNKVNLKLVNMDEIDVVVNKKAFGHKKTYLQHKIMTPLDFIDEEFDRFIGVFKPEAKTVTSKKFIRESQYIEGDLAAYIEARKEKETAYREATYDVELAEGDSFEIIQTGRYSKADPFEFQHKFRLENQWIKKAGDNYLIEIGKAMGKQRSVNKEERKRNIDIDLDFTHTIENEIILQIPDGYEVVGIEKLNKSVINETGGFRSQAKIEDNTLILSTKKIYAKQYVKKENWDKMLEWIDLGFEIYQAKVMLKKS